jgi:hypothetical protein
MMKDPMIEGHESVLLAALMNGSGDLPVTVEDFSTPPNRAIFSAIDRLSNRSHLAVMDALSGQLEKIGGEPRLLEIRDFPTDKANVDYALECVLDASRERRGTKIGMQLASGDITPEQAQEQLSKLNESRRDLPIIEDAAELISREIVLPDDVIQGVLHRGGKMVLGGASKTFKTWLLLDTAISVGTGTHWLGQYATKRGRVLYINLEILNGFFARRIRTICEARQLKIEPGRLEVWNLRGYATDLSKLLPRMLRGIGREQYDLIIIDPIYKLLGARDENKAGDIASLLNEIEALAVKTGAAVAFGAHYSKGNQSQKDAADRIGGSGVFARDPDTILNFTRHEENDCFTVEATLRNHPPLESFVVRWEFPLMHRDDELDPNRLKKAMGAPKKVTEQQVLDLLERPMRPREYQNLIAQQFDVSLATAERRIKDLERSGRIDKVAGHWERATHQNPQNPQNPF